MIRTVPSSSFFHGVVSPHQATIGRFVTLSITLRAIALDSTSCIIHVESQSEQTNCDAYVDRLACGRAGS